MQIFDHGEDYAAFERVIEETLRAAAMRICAFCWLPNRWHFVLWPERDGDLSEFMQRMANMHTQRWQRAKQRVGYGHLYQARFKSFPIENDAHFYSVVRYVERNALRAGLVGRAEDWPWGSLCRRVVGRRTPLLADWPLPEPPDWRVLVDALPKPNWRPSGDAFVEAVLTALPLGPTAPPRNLVCNRPCVPAVVHRGTRTRCIAYHSQCIYVIQYMRLSPGIPLYSFRNVENLRPPTST
jgi:REP element-mobilizing transposase RayT